MSAEALSILHIAETPLVGAPSKLAAAQRACGAEALSVSVKDYPQGGPLYQLFAEGLITLERGEAHLRAMVTAFLKRVQIVHVHNSIPEPQVAWLREHAQHAAFVYQTHSPLREGPLYVTRAEHLGLPFAAHMAVAQYHPRQYPDYLPVPNLVLDMPYLRERQPGERLRVMFSPANKQQTGRWNRKFSERLNRVLDGLVETGKIELVVPEIALRPTALMLLRRSCHVSIDEILTGAFHQVSLEGLCAGNVVINRADYFSKLAFASAVGAPELPPFQCADEDSVAEVLIRLADDVALTAQLQRQGYDYFRAHLDPKKLTGLFLDAYRRLL